MQQKDSFSNKEINKMKRIPPPPPLNKKKKKKRSAANVIRTN